MITNSFSICKKSEESFEICSTQHPAELKLRSLGAQPAEAAPGEVKVQDEDSEQQREPSGALNESNSWRETRLVKPSMWANQANKSLQGLEPGS
jgi:hypothetical protein